MISEETYDKIPIWQTQEISNDEVLDLKNELEDKENFRLFINIGKITLMDQKGGKFLIKLNWGNK